MGEKCRILYCNCAHARVVPDEVKNAVLDKLCETDADISWQAVSDLCEMVARRDPALKNLRADDGNLKIAACFPRAVKWLFASSGVPLDPERTQICNMREQSAGEIMQALLSDDITPNVPEGTGKAPAEVVAESEGNA